MTQYLIKTRSESFVIEIDETWKITFASVNPASNMGRNDGYCVRVYEMPGSKLRAVFDSVLSIRDLSIKFARQNRSETGSVTWTRDDGGSMEEQRKIEAKDTFVVDEENIPF